MSKKDDEINRQLIFNSGGANPEDYLTPKQLKRYKENPERFIDIDVDLAMNQEGEEELKDYEQNRAINDAFRFDQPNRAFEQYKTILEYIPDTKDPAFTSELFLDMKTGFDAAKKVPGGPVPKIVAAGGAVAARRLGGKALRGLIDNVFDNVDPYGFLGSFRKGDVGAKKIRPGNFSTTGTFNRARFYYSPEHTQKIANELVNTWGMKNLKFDFDKYEIMRSKVVPSKSRLFGELFESVPYTKLNFKAMQEATVQGETGIRAKYSRLMQHLGFPPRKFELHHTVPIKGSLPGYDGLAFGSDEWWDVTEILFRNMLRPGDDAFNLIALVGGNKATTLMKDGVPYRFPTPHSMTHKFLDDKIGPSGELFWTKKVRTKMKKDFDYRRQKWQQYSEIVKKSQDITNQAELTFRDLYENIAEDQLSDELDLVIERLVQLDNAGKLDTKKVAGRYQVPQMQELVLEVGEEMKASQLDAMLDSVTGRQEKLREFVKKRIFEDFELRQLNQMTVAEQIAEIQKMTGMSMEDLQLIIQTNPKFDIIKFIRDNQ